MIYIYVLRCPETGRPRYIGKTKNIRTRLASHVVKAKTGHTNHHCAEWIRSLLSRGLQPELMVIQQLPDGSDWQRAESDVIASYLAAGHDLTNLTAGGDGFHDVHPDVIARRVEARRKTLSEPARHADFVRVTAAARATDTVRFKQSGSVKAAWQDPEKKARFLAGMRTPAAVARRAAATRRRNADPAFAERHAVRMKELSQHPDRRRQLDEARTKRWREYRERQGVVL